MKVLRKSTAPFSAKITLGLFRNYSNIKLSKEDIMSYIQAYQDALIANKGLHLSISISETIIILSNQREPHLTLSFINYPKFPIPIEILRNEIQIFAESLMKEFEQNRLVVEFPDETVMLEQSENIDPRITTKDGE